MLSYYGAQVLETCVVRAVFCGQQQQMLTGLFKGELVGGSQSQSQEYGGLDHSFKHGCVEMIVDLSRQLLQIGKRSCIFDMSCCDINLVVIRFFWPDLAV